MPNGFGSDQDRRYVDPGVSKGYQQKTQKERDTVVVGPDTLHQYFQGWAGNMIEKKPV